MPCSLPTRKYVQAIVLEMPCKLPIASTFQPFGPWQPGSPQVLSSQLVVKMLCGLPNRRYFKAIWCLKCRVPCRLPTRRYFQAILCLKCRAACQRESIFKPFGPLPPHWYFQAIWCLKCPAGCQPAATPRPLGA